MYSHILVPVAMDHIDNASKTLDIAHRLLREGGKITLLHVIEDIPSFAQSYLPEGTIQQNEDHAAQKLDTLAHGEDHDYDSAIVHGKPSLEILEYAKKNAVECIVIASHKPGLEDYLIGSTAARVVRHGKCCVHVSR